MGAPRISTERSSLGQRNADAIVAGHAAIRTIDKMIRGLHELRGQLMNELRQDEFTHGDENGWHPHYHALIVHNDDLEAAAIAQLQAHIHSRLVASCRDHNLRQPDQLHAVRVDPNVSATAAGAYVAKGGDWTLAEAAGMD